MKLKWIIKSVLKKKKRKDKIKKIEVEMFRNWKKSLWIEIKLNKYYVVWSFENNGIIIVCCMLYLYSFIFCY